MKKYSVLIFNNLENSEITELFCQKKISVNCRVEAKKSKFYDYTPLEFAAKEVYSETIKVLLKYQANPNLRNAKGQTVLHTALSQQQISLDDIKSLVDHGANVNISDHEGNSPLWYASSTNFDRYILVEFLCQKQANVNLQSSQGDTALHIAACHDHEETVKVLLKYKANPNLTDKNGRRPIDLAKGKTKAILKEAQKCLSSE